MVDKEVGESHEVLTPREHDRKNRGSEQCPLHRTFHHQQSQHKQHQHEGAHIHRAARHRLLAPILSYLLIQRQVVRVGFLHGLFVARQGHRGAALGIRNEQRPCLADAVGPLRDVVALQSARRLVARVGLHQFALATHGLLRILPRMIEVGNVYQNTYGTGSQTHRRGLYDVLPAGGLGIAAGQALNDERHHHHRYREQIIVGHLHVVGLHLKGGEEGREDESPQVFSSVGQHDAGNHRRQVGQRPHLPDVAGRNDDEEITAEGPDNAAQYGQFAAEVEGAHQDVEAQKIGKNKPHILREPQVVGIHHFRQQVGTLVRGRRLIGRHAAERGIGPTGALARLLQVFQCFLSGTTTCRRIVLIQNAPLQVCRHEIGEGDDRKQHYCQHIWQILLQFFHKLHINVYICPQRYKEKFKVQSPRFNF